LKTCAKDWGTDGKREGAGRRCVRKVSGDSGTEKTGRQAKKYRYQLGDAATA